MQTHTVGLSWRLQDAKAQFSAVVDGALRGVPQHVTRRGKQAVVVVSEQDFAALQSQGGRQAVSFIQHLRAMPLSLRFARPLAEPPKSARPCPMPLRRVPSWRCVSWRFDDFAGYRGAV